MSSLLFSDNTKIQYLVDQDGKKRGVLLDIKLFDALMQELEDLYDITQAERIIEKKGKLFTLEEVCKKISPKKKCGE